MRIATVVGARPQFLKAATIARRLRDPAFSGIDEVIIHTGQHYDDNMSGSFFRELDIPSPGFNLRIGSGRAGAQTGAMMAALETCLDDLKPDLVLVYGDTNSTLAAALVAAKAGLPLAHVEAGLRSFRRAMPEEINRVVTDRLSDHLFCPTKASVNNLATEGRRENVHLVGDVMFDAYRHTMSHIDTVQVLNKFGLAPRGYVMATVHRAENTDDPGRLAGIIRSLAEIAEELPVLLPLHPRTQAALDHSGLSTGAIRLCDPLGHGNMMALLSQAAALATDSGGLQKEAYFAVVPCITLRDETEWIETLDSGWNRLAPPSGKKGDNTIRDTILGAIRQHPGETPPEVYGDGDAAGKILRLLRDI